MKFTKKSKDPMLSILSSTFVSLPAPLNISYLWNFGSLLSVCLFIQLSTGVFLSFHYMNSADLAFSSVIEIMRNMNYGSTFRLIHANGASMFFLCLYVHVGRGVYYGSYRFIHTWSVGVSMLLLSMGTAFLGYVLPWGQMSFWGAMVITNLLSTVPYIGLELVYWLWGGFSVDSPTLTRFFSLHFISPFVISALTMIHILYLHSTGSSNPLGLNKDQIKLVFYPYLYIKDLLGMLLFMLILLGLVFFWPYLLSDPENFSQANPCATPPHIQPEWYFLFPYAILRAIPNKLGGVIALLSSVLILYTLPILPLNNYRSNCFYPLSQVLFWGFISTLLLLMWIGSQPVEDPFVFAGRLLTLFYFMFYFMDPMCKKLWDKYLEEEIY